MFYITYNCSIADNVELVLKSISNQHSTESQDNDQPDYDSVASDEETDLENAPAKSNREKVSFFHGKVIFAEMTLLVLKFYFRYFCVKFKA